VSKNPESSKALKGRKPESGCAKGREQIEASLQGARFEGVTKKGERWGNLGEEGKKAMEQALGANRKYARSKRERDGNMSSKRENWGEKNQKKKRGKGKTKQREKKEKNSEKLRARTIKRVEKLLLLNGYHHDFGPGPRGRSTVKPDKDLLKELYSVKRSY